MMSLHPVGLTLSMVIFLSCWSAVNSGLLTNHPIMEINLNETGFENVSLERFNVSESGLEVINPVRLEKIRESNKKQRIQSIQSQIMQRLGLQSKPNITFVVPDNARELIARKLEELRNEQENGSFNRPNEIYAERVQSFYPSCSLPRNTDRDIWDDPKNFHIYYNISSPRQMQGTSINVSAAKLRLYKNVDTPVPTVNIVTEGEETGLINDQPWFEDASNRSEDEDQLRITVFQYLKPLRRHRRPKKKELDSKTVATNYEGWIEFNIQSSIRDWFENGNKNFGLGVILQDANDVTHNPSSVFQNMNCSESRATDPPFPRNLFEDDPTVGDNESALFDNETYPTLDLRTVEFQEEEMIPIRNVSDRRHKRHTKNGDQQCYLKTTYINFEQMGFDWIIAPEGILDGECVGSCQDGEEQKKSESTRSICRPDKYSSFSFISFNNDDQIRLHVYENFTVTSCSCFGEELSN